MSTATKSRHSTFRFRMLRMCNAAIGSRPCYTCSRSRQSWCRQHHLAHWRQRRTRGYPPIAHTPLGHLVESCHRALTIERLWSNEECQPPSPSNACHRHRDQICSFPTSHNQRAQATLQHIRKKRGERWLWVENNGQHRIAIVTEQIRNLFFRLHNQHQHTH